MSKDKKKLGRGLSALLGDDDDDLMSEEAAPQVLETAVRAGTVVTLSIGDLSPSPFQPRTHFDADAIEELAASIRERGIIQPILVRKSSAGDTEYEIIAGERRWRAAQQAQLHEVPVLIREFDDRATAEIALIENLQRQDLSALEEAEGYLRLMEEFEHTQEVLGRIVGKSRSHIANTLRLLSLPEGIKSMVTDKRLSAGHARALLGADQAETLADEVIKKGLNVRQTESLVKKAGGKESRPKHRTAAVKEKDPDTLALERDLTNMLGLSVSIDFDGSGGRLTVRYDTLEQLDDLLHRLNGGTPKPPVQTVVASSEPEQVPEADESQLDDISDFLELDEDDALVLDDDLNSENELVAQDDAEASDVEEVEEDAELELIAELEAVADDVLEVGALELSDSDVLELDEGGDAPIALEEVDEDELDVFLNPEDGVETSSVSR